MRKLNLSMGRKSPVDKSLNKTLKNLAQIPNAFMRNAQMIIEPVSSCKSFLEMSNKELKAYLKNG